MPLSKLSFQAGINRESTSYANEGGWFDCDKIRFRQGYVEKIGGWVKKSNQSFLGSPRDLHNWVALDGSQYISVGTPIKYYIEEGGAYNDITPLRLTSGAGDATFSATNGSSLITVTEADHGVIEGSFVTFSGAVSLGGNITADVLNQEYRVEERTASNTFTIKAREASTSIGSITVNGELSPVEVTANSSDTGNGGGSTVAAYQINPGLDTVVAGNGWGAGTWGRETWNSGTSATATSDVLRLWQQDNFGEDLLLNVVDGQIFFWDKSTSSNLGGFGRCVELKDLAGADSAVPTVARQVLVSDNDRHVIVFGCDPAEAIGTQDPLLIRFGSQASITSFEIGPENTAGFLRVGSGSAIVRAIETREQILVFTESSLHSLQFLGAPFFFGLTQISENTTIMGMNSAVAVDDVVYWMGKNDFYVFDGRAKKIPCTVKEFVFSDFNQNQADQVIAGANSSFNEVWWFYPSQSATLNDRYVIFNYQQNIWYFGSLARTAWMDRGINDTPIASSGGFLFLHESGFDDGSTSPASSIDAHVESSQFDIEDGDSFSFVRRILPDVSFEQSTADSPTMNLTLKARNFPGANYHTTEASAVTRSATVPVEQFTNQAHVRLRGRSMALRAESTQVGVKWRLGTPRIDIRRDGRR
jgi:hypothetical protein